MKPSFQSIVDKQRIADHRLHRDTTTRSGPENAHYRRVLEAVPLADVGLPRLPLVTNSAGERFVLLGELAQLPGTVLLFDIVKASMKIEKAEQLMLLPVIESLDQAPGPEDPVGRRGLI